LRSHLRLAKKNTMPEGLDRGPGDRQPTAK
jgi:hypothetical protein